MVSTKIICARSKSNWFALDGPQWIFETVPIKQYGVRSRWVTNPWLRSSATFRAHRPGAPRLVIQQPAGCAFGSINFSSLRRRSQRRLSRFRLWRNGMSIANIRNQVDQLFRLQLLYANQTSRWDFIRTGMFQRVGCRTKKSLTLVRKWIDRPYK